MIRIAAALVCMALAAPSAVAQQSRDEQRAHFKTQQAAIKAARRLGEMQFGKDHCDMALDQAVVDDLVATAMMGGQLMDVTFVMMTLKERAQTFGLESICKALRTTHAAK